MPNSIFDNIPPVPVERGGTGHKTAEEAINFLLNSGAVPAGKLLSSDGLELSWIDEEDAESGVSHTTGQDTDLVMSQGAISQHIASKLDAHYIPEAGNIALSYGDHSTANYLPDGTLNFEESPSVQTKNNSHNVVFGTGANSATAGDDWRFLSFADPSWSIESGCGLTVSGDLLSEICVDLNFGDEELSVLEGNDPRILNGQTAFDWGDHKLAGYKTAFELLAEAEVDYTAGAGIYFEHIPEGKVLIHVEFGTDENTVLEGSDERLDINEEAYSWGDHKGVYFTKEPTEGFLSIAEVYAIIAKMGDDHFSIGEGLHILNDMYQSISIDHGTEAGSALDGNFQYVLGDHTINDLPISTSPTLTHSNVGAAEHGHSHSKADFANVPWFFNCQIGLEDEINDGTIILTTF